MSTTDSAIKRTLQCEQCGFHMIPRVVTHIGRPVYSFCPFCGQVVVRYSNYGSLKRLFGISSKASTLPLRISVIACLVSISLLLMSDLLNGYVAFNLQLLRLAALSLSWLLVESCAMGLSRFCLRYELNPIPVYLLFFLLMMFTAMSEILPVLLPWLILNGLFIRWLIFVTYKTLLNCIKAT